MAKKNKKPTVKGTKQRAGLILSSMMRSIAEEVTELNKGTDSEDKMISKAEALARLVWKKALGYTDQVVTNGELVDREYPPDRVYVGMLLDRLEGRVAAVESGKKEKRTVADRIGDQSKKRINAAAKKAIE